MTCNCCLRIMASVDSNTVGEYVENCMDKLRTLMGAKFLQQSPSLSRDIMRSFWKDLTKEQWSELVWWWMEYERFMWFSYEYRTVSFRESFLDSLKVEISVLSRLSPMDFISAWNLATNTNQPKWSDCPPHASKDECDLLANQLHPFVRGICEHCLG